MEFLLQLLVSFWFGYLLFQSFKIATITSINEGRTKPSGFHIILLILCFTVVLFGWHYVWFGLDFKL